MPKPLPPDPEGMNDDRAGWAGEALHYFRIVTGTEPPDLLPDLLVDLMHWCDRNDVSFSEALAKANQHYQEETQG